MKNSVLFKEMGTMVNANVLRINLNELGTSYFHNLEIGICQYRDTSCETKVIINTVTKQDLINLAELFRDLAGQISQP